MLITTNAKENKLAFAKVNDFKGRTSLQVPYKLDDLKELIKTAESQGDNTVALSIPCTKVDDLTVSISLQQKDAKFDPSVVVFHNFMTWNYKK